MSLAEVEPNATRRPRVKASEPTSMAALEAMSRFEGPANGIRFSKKEVSRTPKSSKIDANLFSAFVFADVMERGFNKCERF